MAQKDIDPFATRKKALPPELLAKVTKQAGPVIAAKPAAKPAVLPQTPMSRKPLPAGIQGNPPLPTGRAVAGISPGSLTPGERESLEAVGWTDDVPIPSNMAEILNQEQARRLAEEVPMPVDPRTPPVKVTTVDINSLPSAEQQRLMNTMRAAVQNEKLTNEAQAASMTSGITTPGLAEAMHAANQATAAFRGDTIEDDRTAPAATTTPATPPPVPEATHVHESPTGANAMMTNCPHCSWDLSQPDIAEPPHSDKMAFLHCLLGQSTYAKAYPLFGGNVEVTFRTLTTREIDTVYKQAYADQELGKSNTELDYWERVNRYRLLLQLQKYQAFGTKGFIHDLHDGYSKEANPDAASVWVKPEQAAELPPNETGIPVIEEWLIENILKTEAIFRVAANACNQFNRLVAKMEAMADNSDFWNPTEAQH